MSTSLVPLNKAQLPAHLRKGGEQARALGSELAAGVTAGFPIISYRGKVWRVRKGGEEIDFLDRKRNAVPSIDIVLVKSNKNLSKTFYKGKWTEGDNSPPDCWSSDGVRPDEAVKEKQHAVCATCPRNAWGSRITEQGKKGRECSDVRRMAVAFVDEVAKKGADAHLFLLRIPPASLNPLKDFSDKVLGPAGVEYFAVGTQVGFDSTASHPKLTFSVATDNDDSPRFLTEEEYEAVLKLRSSPEAEHILSEEPDYASAGTTGEGDAAAPSAEATPAPVKAPAKAKARPVDDEDVPTKDASPAPQTAEEDEDDDDGEAEAAEAAAVAAAAAAAAAAAKVKAKKAKVKAAPAPAPDEDADDSSSGRAAPATAKGGFDDILESLLGGSKK